MNVTHITLKRLAALVWYIGPLILFMKGSELAASAQEMEPESWNKTVSWLAGVLVGLIKTRFIFLRSNRRNLFRIDSLNSPKLWEFYRPQFFFFLGLMLLLGRTLSVVSQGNAFFMVAVAILDISIGTALFLSSIEFWKHGVFSFSAKAEPA